MKINLHFGHFANMIMFYSLTERLNNPIGIRLAKLNNFKYSNAQLENFMTKHIIQIQKSGIMQSAG